MNVFKIYEREPKNSSKIQVFWLSFMKLIFKGFGFGTSFLKKWNKGFTFG